MGGVGAHEGLGDLQGHAVRQRDPQDAPDDGGSALRQAQVRLVQEARRTTADLASITSSTRGISDRPTRLRRTAVRSTNSRCPGSVHRRPCSPVGGMAGQQRHGRAQQPEGGEPHRGDRTVQALGQAETEVDPAGRSRRRCTCRQGVERRDGAGLGEPHGSVSVDGPLDVLRRAGAALDRVTESSQLAQLLGAEAGRAVVVSSRVVPPRDGSGSPPACRPGAGAARRRSSCPRRSGRG